MAYKHPPVKACKDMYGYVYLTRCTVNDKIYVGLRHGCPSPKYVGSGKVLCFAIKKHGIRSFVSSVLEACPSQEELCQCERDWISIFRAMGADLYNISPGGESLGSGINNVNYGRKASPETREKLRKEQARRKRENPLLIEKQRAWLKKARLRFKPTKEQALKRMKTMDERHPGWRNRLASFGSARKGKKIKFTPEHCKALKDAWARLKISKSNNKTQ